MFIIFFDDKTTPSRQTINRQAPQLPRVQLAKNYATNDSGRCKFLWMRILQFRFPSKISVQKTYFCSTKSIRLCSPEKGIRRDAAIHAHFRLLYQTKQANEFIHLL